MQNLISLFLPNSWAAMLPQGEGLTIFNIIHNDVAEPWQLGFQDSAAPGFTGLVNLHNTIGFYLIVISFSVFWVLFSLIYYYSFNKNPIAHKYLTHGTVLELVWTITPALILIAIAFPSFTLLYLMDEVISPTLTIKVVGLFINLAKLILSFFIFIAKQLIFILIISCCVATAACYLAIAFYSYFNLCPRTAVATQEGE